MLQYYHIIHMPWNIVLNFVNLFLLTSVVNYITLLYVVWKQKKEDTNMRQDSSNSSKIFYFKVCYKITL